MSTTNSPPEKLRKPNENHVPWLLRRIWDRINRKNEHFMGVIVGREGSGKSYTAIKIADNVDPTFNADRVIFDVADLLEELKDGNHDAGNWYVLDEAGVQLGRRSWQERSQVLANQALQLIRDHNLGLIFTLPRLSEFDSQAEGRLQAAFEVTKKVDGEYVEGKWKFFDPDRMDDSGTIYKKYPRRRQHGELKKIRKLRFTPPETDVVGEYEEQKNEFQEEFYQKTIDKIRGNEEDGDDGEADRSIKQVAMDVVQDDEEFSKYVSQHNQTKVPYINKEVLRVEQDLSHNDAQAVKGLLENRFDEEELRDYV